ncbi:MAG: hypothetical protein ACYC7E_16875 [Armatimonadota bacterium]
MSRWIHGRQGRPIAGIAICILLVSLLVPLAPPPVQAQLTDAAKEFFGGEGSISVPTEIVVLDYDNRSRYGTGMLGRVFTDALAVEMLNLKGTTKFSVARRADVERVLAESNLSVPMSYTSQAMVADRLNCKYVFSGEIQAVTIHRSPEGTYAEVTVRTVVIHKTIKEPINGALITQVSSPKIGYSGNTDVLVQEALATAAYRTSQTLLDNRLPIGTILMSARTTQLLMKGGSTIGFRPGMKLVAMRRDSVTGRLKVISVTPTDSIVEITEDSKGVAVGDKTVPIFEFDYQSKLVPKKKRDEAGLQLAGVGLLGVLATLVGTQGGTSHLQTVSAPTVVPMSDAYQGHTRGANYLTWQDFGPKAIAILIYRDTNIYAPIAVLPASQREYIDTANFLPQTDAVMETQEFDIAIDSTTGLLEDPAVPQSTEWETELDNWYTPDMTLSDTDFTISARRRPLKPADTVRYMLRVLYMEYLQGDIAEGELGHPDEYVLRLGDIGAMSVPVVVTQPPLLETPGDGEVQIDGYWLCTRVPAATEYCLQVSADNSQFNPATTVEITFPVSIGDTFVTIEYLLSQIYVNPKLMNANVIWWRMGARVEPGFPLPASAQGLLYMTGWVFSPVRHFDLPAVPPPGSRVRRMLTPGTLYVPGMNEKGTTGRGAGRQGLFNRR